MFPRDLNFFMALPQQILIKLCSTATRGQNKRLAIANHILGGYFGPVTWVVYHLPQITGNSCWDVNGKRFFASYHWKISGTNGISGKSSPVFPVGTFRMKIRKIRLSFTSFLRFRASFLSFTL